MAALWIMVAVVGIVPPLMVMLYRPKAAQGLGGLHYSRAARVFLGFVGLGCVALSVAPPMALSLDPKPIPLQVLVMLAFMPVISAGGVWILGDVWFVRHQFDEHGVRYRSPWSRRALLRWEDVVEVRFRPAAQWIDLRDASGRTYHFSTMLAGIAPFSRTLLSRVQVTPATARVLEAIASGRTAELTGMTRV